MIDAKVIDGHVLALEGRISLSVADILARQYTSDVDASVVVAGTLVEGIGTLHSDFDVYIICNVRPKVSQLHSHHNQVQNVKRQYTDDPNDDVLFVFDYIGDRGTHLQVHYLPESEITVLGHHINDLYDAAVASAKVIRTTLGYVQEDLVHRLHNALVLSGHDRFRDCVSRIDRARWLYLCFRNVYCPWPEFKDIIGFWLEERFSEALIIARSYLSNQMLALTHLLGNTNRKHKWLLAALDASPQQIATIRRQYETLMFSAAADPQEQEHQLTVACELLDKINKWCCALLDNSSVWPSTTETLSAVDREFVDVRGLDDRQVSLEHTFRRMVYGGANVKALDIVQFARQHAGA